MELRAFVELVQETIRSDAAMTGETLLSELPEWDSLAIIAVMGMLNLHFSLTVDMNRIKACPTVADLHLLAGGKSSE